MNLGKCVLERIQELTESDDIDIPLSQIPPSQSKVAEPLPVLDFTDDFKFIAIHFKMQGNTFDAHFTKGVIFNTKEEANDYKQHNTDEMIAILQSSNSKSH